MFKASREFVILSLDGSCAVEDRLEEGKRATALSIVDHNIGRPDSFHFNNMTLLEFARQYSIPKTFGAEPIVVNQRPYVSSDPASEKYCRLSLMQLDDLISGYDTYIDAYAAFFQSGQIPSGYVYHILNCFITGVCSIFSNTDF